MTYFTSHPAAGHQSRKGQAVQRLKWRLNRLRAMSLLEIGFRLEERLKRLGDSHRRFGWQAFDVGEGALPHLPITIDADDRRTAEQLKRWRILAREATAEKLEFLGRPWLANQGDAAWHWDPVTRTKWPRDIHCHDIAVHGNTGYGDIRYVWELNRLQHLQPLAALAATENDRNLQTYCLRQIDSWIDANPPFNGVNWASNLEIALRTVSLLIVLSFTDRNAIPPDLNRRLRTCLNAHGYWLSRNPSRYSSANNHKAAASAALFLIGTTMPDLEDAKNYTTLGRITLMDAVEEMFHEDGVGAEQSLTYAGFTLELAMLCLWLGEQCAEPFPAATRERIGKAGEFLRWMTDSKGNQPRIGDDDGGSAFYAEPESRPHYVSSVLGCVAELLDRPDLQPPAVAPCFRNIVLGDPPRRTRKPKGVRSFDAGGYTVLRQPVSGRDAMLVLDHGPLGHLSIAAHGHADALALWLHLDGTPVLVDAGTYLFGSPGPWRNHFRGTSAHNTLSIDGRNSSRISGCFSWTRKAQAWRDHENAPDGGVAACHDGFKRHFGVVHRREVTPGETSIKVTDSLEGRPLRRHQVDIGYLVNPELNVTLHRGAASIALGGRTLLHLIPGPNLNVSLEQGETSPPRGWHSRGYGQMNPAPRIVFRPSVDGETTWTTEFLICR